jgi:hypothetical protein
MKTRIMRGLEGLLVGLIGLMGMICDCDGQTTNVPGIYPLTGQALAAGTLANFVIVSKTGSDASGARNNYGLPFATITAAKAAAVAGDTIYVLPGVYQENNLLKPGVNYHFWTGASLAYTNTGVTLATGLGLFDDRGTGATTNRITGALDFFYSSGTNANGGCHGNTNSVGAIVLTNSNSDLYFEFHNADGAAFPDCNTVPVNGVSGVWALFFVSKCRRCELKGEEILNSCINDTPNGVANGEIGIYWENGELYVNAKHLAPFLNYGIWPNTRTDTDENMWVNIDRCDGYVYASLTSSKQKCWYDFKQLTVTNLSTDAFAPIAGRHYLRAEKILAYAAGYCIRSAGGAEVWATVQKLTAPAGGGWVSANASTNYITVQQYEAPTNNNLSLASGVVAISGGVNIQNDNGLHWSGNSGNTALAAATTYFFAPNNQSSTLPTTDVSAGTRATVSRATVLRDLYLTQNAASGSGKSYTATIMTNGVASSITCAVTGASATTANDTTHRELILAGTEVGIKIVTDSGAATDKVSWSFEGQ